jgi:hypothetical protein
LINIPKDNQYYLISFSFMEENRPGHFYFASESVGEGHPDKLCDQISDGVLDACLTIDPHAKAGVEAATKTKMV